MQKHVNLVDLVKSFPTNIFLQNLASIQKRTSPIKFAHMAEKSEKGSVSNLSTKAETVQLDAGDADTAYLDSMEEDADCETDGRTSPSPSPFFFSSASASPARSRPSPSRSAGRGMHDDSVDSYDSVEIKDTNE